MILLKFFMKKLHVRFKDLVWYNRIDDVEAKITTKVTSETFSTADPDD
jgi:hypothetical protein